ncbi:LamG domain-containing protein [Vibrio vulnificus]|uniref:LamG-like jellyroll fold domain-containing protein n=1 Tax=Vibrio vulnificus TaxID=672 RepID=UPI001023B584|nr:LamG-like jellyroll fold domain-containing protein [Vibrio vulnificus]EGQ8175086.1 LamG domain-containing protein [Vibrio vulnificus]EGQ9237887.1 LamG domain-containing protein [Vibrio vulnificus]EGQ9330196.1 LamG domain-containing protein [Vibrio vulnificus]EGQ9783263.1 LamG domain-containing protein [Vibrio vulnificus]EGR0086192.1 LamG domain-containing protein [Vibrio vulnificus]
MPVSLLNILKKLCILFFLLSCPNTKANQVSYQYNLRGQLVSEQHGEQDRYHSLDALGNRISISQRGFTSPLEAVVIVEPVNNAKLNLSQEIKLQWQPVDGAQSYDIWLGKAPEQLHQLKTGIRSASVYADFASVSDIQPRYWKVVANDGKGMSSSSPLYIFSALDSDSDQLPDHIEEKLCTSALDSDTDNDGLTDSQEIRFGESAITSSFPCLQDSDFDGIEDAYEVKVGSDPMVVDSYRGDSWARYVNWIAEKHQQKQVEIVSNPRVLDIRNNDGYAISGFAPNGEALSLTYWIKHSQSDAKQTMGSHDDSDRRFYVGIDENNQVTYGVGDEYRTLKGEKIEDEHWTHVAMSYANGTAHLYINGQLKHTAVGVNFKKASQYALWFGSRHHKRAWQPESIEGVIDNLSVWNVALSHQDVARSMFSLDTITSSHLVAYYDFNQSRGEWVQNRVTSKFDLKLAAGAKLSKEDNYLDTDGDGIPDTFELALCSDSSNSDSDGDGVSDGEEFGLDSRLNVVSNACQMDSDNDGVPDSYEYQLGMNPVLNDALALDPATGETYWHGYVLYHESADSNLDVVEQDRHFDVTDSKAYAITGYTNKGGDFSLMYWFKPKTLSEQYSGFSESGLHKLTLGISRDSRVKGLFNVLGVSDHSKSILTNQWQHFALTWNEKSSQLCVYLNGELAYETKWRLWYTPKEALAFWIGAQNRDSSPEHHMNGTIDNVQIWNHSLAQHQVRRYMTEPPKDKKRGLVAYYDFSKSRGEWVYNKATEKFDLKLTDKSRLQPAEPDQDSDGDGLSDAFEAGLCLDPNKRDSDGDGIPDKQELVPSITLKSTDPCSADTDNDGIDDKFELENSMDPTSHDLNHLESGRDTTNWQFYAKQSVERLLALGNKAQSLAGELNLSGNLGYAISDILPEKLSEQVTFMYWFKSDKSGLTQFSGVQYTEYSGHFIGIDTANKPFARSWAQGLNAEGAIENNEWNHFALVISKNTKKLYVNGQLEEVIDLNLYGRNDMSSVYSMWFGAVNYLGKETHHQSGQIDDIQVWNRPLTQGDIINYMRKSPDVNDQDLVAWYDFSQYLGNWVRNAVTGNYDLKLVKGAHIVESAQSNDSDKDGLSDEFEATYCTDPQNVDSDGDGLSDGQEINVGFVINGKKVTTDPCSSDTDNDGIDDAFEVDNNMNPTLVDGHIVDSNEQQTHWQRYVEHLNNSNAFKSASEQAMPGVLDVEGTKGYAISGYYPTTGPLTIMFWYKPNEEISVYNQSLSGVTDVNSSSSLALGQSIYGAMYRVEKYGEHAYDHDLVNNQWNHLALTLSQKQTTLYVNGQRAKDSKATLKAIGYPFFLGAANVEGLASQHMNGQIDNVMKWRRELTREEIRRFMITPPNPASDNAMEWLYRFNHIKNGWVKNEVTNLYDLKLVNGAKISAESPVVDLDKDGLDDKLEVASCLDETLSDTDGDGLLDGQEYGVNSNYSVITDPCLVDTDRDNVPDSFEVKHHSNPLTPDSGSKANSTNQLNNWQVYANYHVNKLPQASHVEAKRALQLTQNKGYAITNHFSASHDMTLMFWTPYQERSWQRLGSMGSHELGFASSNVIYGDKYTSRFKPSNLSPNGWVHLALVLSSEGPTQLYINGMMVDEKSPHRADLPNLWATYIGAVNDNGVAKEHMEGLIDNVGIWTRALAPAEIYQYMFTTPAPNNSGLSAWYDFTQSKGDWVMNMATGEYDLLLVNGAHLVAEPTDDDSDGDGLIDRLELAFCTDGLTADSDGDGISDGDELSVGKPFILITNPCDPDSDNDGLPDDFERTHGSDGLIADANFDSNGNGISNWDEYRKQQTMHIPETTVEFGALSLSQGYAITPYFPKNNRSTFMYWFKSDSLDSQLSGVSNANTQHYYAGVQYAQKKFALGGSGWKGYSFKPAQYSIDSWNHIAMVVEDEYVKFYLNGQLIEKASRSYAKISEPFNHALWLGALNNASVASDFFTGLIDNVQIWDRALSERELYRSMALPPKENLEGLVASYDFSSVKGKWVKNLANGQFDLKLVDDIEIETHQVNDTDLDTIPDYVEAQLCIDANQSDTDQDGLSDRQELEQLNSACNADVDGDGMLDGFEMLEGSNMHVGDGDKDSNGDGITNWYSFIHWYQQHKLSHGEQVVALSNGMLNLMGQADSRLITGLYPDATDKTLMFDINYHQLKGLNQRLGADDNNNHRFYIGLDKDGDFSYGVGDERAYRKVTINTGQWYHFTLRYQHPNAQAYIDGEQIGTLSNIRFKGKSSLPLSLGGTSTVNALIDNVQFWNRALSDEELSNYQTKAPNGDEHGLQAYYDFESRLGSMIMNRATNKFDALLSAEDLVVEKQLEQ